MDRILIKDLTARCIIGINEEERREKQDVTVNLVLFADLRQAGRSDRFEEAVDYRALKKRIVKMVEGSEYYLMEALAQAIADICLEEAGVQRVQVTLEKPFALRYARSVGVQITRERT